MRVLLTGSEGFIGGHARTALEAAGHEVVGFDVKHGHSTVDIADVKRAVASVDAVVHLAGVLGSQETIEDPYPAVEVNTLGSLNVFTACAGKPCVFLVCGNWFAKNSYAISKTAAESFAQMFNLYRGGRINVVRAVNAYGPGQVAAAPFGPSKVRKIMPAFVCRALSGVPVEIYGDGQQISDMVYVTDVADQLVRALGAAAAGDVWDAPFGCGPRLQQTVLSTAEMVLDVVGGGEIAFLPMRPGEDPTMPVHVMPSPQQEGFVGLREGVERTVDWYRANEGVTWRRVPVLARAA